MPLTQDEIIRMAREAKFTHLDLEVLYHGNRLERFAALVADATKEKAAKVCEDLKDWSNECHSDYYIGASECAEAIRGMK